MAPVFLRVGAYLVFYLLVANALPQQQDSGNLNLPRLPALPSLQLLPEILGPLRKEIYDPFAFQSGTPKPSQTSTQRPTTSTESFLSGTDHLVEDESNPPCTLDSDCLCYPQWTFCLDTGGRGRCVLNCTQVCGPNIPCLIDPEVTGNKDLTCHLERSRIRCAQRSRRDDDNTSIEKDSSLINKEVEVNTAFVVDSNLNQTDPKKESENIERAIHQFSQNMLIEIAGDEPGNLVFSPFSLQTALTMLTSGAAKDSITKKQLQEAIGSVEDFELFEKHFSVLLENYKTSASEEISSGNRIWTTSEILPKVNPDYIEHLSKTFLTDIAQLDPDLPEVAVNDWINSTTKGLIPHIVDSISNDVVLMLTNAIYFKEAWSAPFVQIPGGKSFTLLDGEVVNVPMMQRSSHEIVTARFGLLDSFPDVVFQSVAIPYASGRFQLIILMAEDPKDLNVLLSKQNLRNGANGENIIGKIAREIDEADKEAVERSVIMPIFTIKSELKVKNYLRKLGVSNAFDDGEFDGISSQVPLKVSGITHVATVEVTTEGTVGAAASGVEIAPFSGLFSQPLEVVINKPFIFSIRDKLQHNILFMGKLVDPTKE